MQNNDLIGKIVLSKCGRDKDHYYVIVDKVDDDYYLLSNGSNKTIQMPKKKNIKHFIVLENVDDEIKASVILKIKGTDLKIKRFLTQLETLHLVKPLGLHLAFLLHHLLT